MEQQINQDQINPDDAKAALGLATRLSGQLMPKAPPPEQPLSAPAQAGQTQEMGVGSVPNQQGAGSAPQQEPVDLEANNKEMEKVMDTKLDDLRKEIKDMIKQEISSIKESIEEALKDE